MNLKQILVLFLFFSVFISCEKKSEEVKPNVNYIYEATYLDTFKMGNSDLVLKVQQMHESIIKKDYESVGSFLADNVEFRLEDGSTIEGKENCMKFMVEGYSSVEIEDYNVAVNLAVTGNNGDEWVLLWDNGTVTSADGTSNSFNWMESFQFENGKIIMMNQFSKPRN